MTVAAGASHVADYARRVLAATHARQSPTMHTRRYRLPFLDLHAAFSDGTYAAHCDRGLAAAPDGTHGVKPERADIVVTDRGHIDIAAPRHFHEAIHEPMELERALAAAGLRGSYFHDNRLWTFYDIEGRRGTEFMQAPGAHPPWETSAPLRPFLHWIYAEQGRRIVHAATLGAGGRGILLAGRGGAGKSGTTIAGMLGGLSTVGDDYVLLDPVDPPVAYPLFRIAKQDEPGYRRLGLAGILPDPGSLNWQDKFEFDIAALRPGGLAEKLEIAALVLPRRTGAARTSFSRIGGREAMLALAPSGIFQMPGNRDTGPRFFAGIVRALPCYRLDLGQDGTEIAARIADFIGGGPR